MSPPFPGPAKVSEPSRPALPTKPSGPGPSPVWCGADSSSTEHDRSIVLLRGAVADDSYTTVSMPYATLPHRSVLRMIVPAGVALDQGVP